MAVIQEQAEEFRRRATEPIRERFNWDRVAPAVP